MKEAVSLRDYIDRRFQDHRAHVDDRFDMLEDQVKANREHQHGGLVSWVALVPVLVTIYGLVVWLT